MASAVIRLVDCTVYAVPSTVSERVWVSPFWLGPSSAGTYLARIRAWSSWAIW